MRNIEGDLEGLPGVAPVATQLCRCAASVVKSRTRGERGQEPFRYHDKGNLATIIRARLSRRSRACG